MDKRIENLEFKKASYLGVESKHPSYHINYYFPNPYYGKEEEYPEDPDNKEFRLYPKNHHCRIHKDCFKHKESCFAVASFDYNEKEEFYEIHFIGERPLDLTEEEKIIFWKLLKYGSNKLNAFEE